MRRTFLNGIRPQGGFYPFNGICLRGRCDALAHGVKSSLRRGVAGQLAEDGFILRSMAEEDSEFAVGHEGASHLSEWDSSSEWILSH